MNKAASFMNKQRLIHSSETIRITVALISFIAVAVVILGLSWLCSSEFRKELGQESDGRGGGPHW